MTLIKWLLTSSADPARYSAMVKGALGLGGAWLIQLSGITCGALLICVDATLVQSAVDTIVNIVYLGLSLISAIVFLWGLGRNMWLNRWSGYQTPPANLPTA